MTMFILHMPLVVFSFSVELSSFALASKTRIILHYSHLCAHFLRRVPTFGTAHASCASRDTQVSYGWCLLMQGYLLRGLKKYAEKTELSKCSWYPKKVGVTMHYSEIKKLQKMRFYPQ